MEGLSASHSVIVLLSSRASSVSPLKISQNCGKAAGNPALTLLTTSSLIKII